MRKLSHRAVTYLSQVNVRSLVTEAALLTSMYTERGALSFLMSVLEFVPLKRASIFFIYHYCQSKI